MERGQVRAKAILIATDEGTRVYRKLDEIPAPLRQQLDACTQGDKSAYLLIADAEGRKKLQGAPAFADKNRPIAPATSPRRWKPDWRLALEIGLCGAIGLLLWMLAALR
jgi:hypothetical protein